MKIRAVLIFVQASKSCNLRMHRLVCVGPAKGSYMYGSFKSTKTGKAEGEETKLPQSKSQRISSFVFS